MFGIAGALRMPGFQLPPGQTYSARFEIWAGPKIYHRLARLDHNEAEIMDFGMFKIVSQFLLNFLNWLHGFLGSYGWSILALTAVVKIVLWPLQSKANQLDAPHVAAQSENPGAARKIQRRPDADEPGGDEAVQGLRNQSGRRLFADDDSNPNLLRIVQNARPGG